MFNKQLVMISGQSGTGKSMSLRNLKNPEGVLYLNCESGKELPFRNKFDAKVIDDPLQVYEAFDYVAENPKTYHTVVVDTLTFLMDMYESQYVIPSTNTMQAWGNYGQYFKNLMQTKVSVSPASVIFLAHTRDYLDEKSMDMKTSVPVKGALQNQGIEAFFSTVVSTKQMTLKDLEKYQNPLLKITERDETLGFKHVFQTQLTKKTVGERVRSPMGMFTVEQTFIDNDCQLLLDHLTKYYS